MCFILVRVILESRHYYIKLFIEIGVSKKKRKKEIGVSHRLPLETCIDDQVF